MTVKELCANEGVNLCYFDGSEWHSPGFFNPVLNILALDINLSNEEQKQVALHELGHKEHTPFQYELNRELCELQADRSMIHHLLEEELKLMDDVRDFNYQSSIIVWNDFLDYFPHFYFRSLKGLILTL